MVYTNDPATNFGTRHVQILFLFTAELIAYAMRSCMSVAIVAMTDTKSNNSDFPVFDWDSKKKSLILSSVLWGSVAAQIPFGFAMMKYNTQKILSSSVLFCSLVYFLTPTLAIKAGWIAVLCCTIAVGLGLACVDPSQHSLLSRWAPLSERARLGSFVLSGANVGTILSMTFAGLLASSNFGWPSIFYIFGLIGAVWAVLFYFLGSNAPADHPKISPEEMQYIENSLSIVKNSNEKKNLKFPWKEILKSLPVWALLFCVCGQLWSLYVLMTQLPTFMKSVLGFDIQKSGGISALPYATKWLVALPISWFSDFALRRGVSVSMVRKVANTVGMWGPGLALVVLCLVQTRNEIVVVAILVMAVGLNAGILSGHNINSVDLCPNFSGTLFSIINTVGKVFGLLAPIACGALVPDTTNINQWYIVFYISAVTYFFSNLVFIMFGRAEKQPWNEPSNTNQLTCRISTISKGCDVETKRH